MGARAVFSEDRQTGQRQTEIVPTMYETRLSSEMKRVKNLLDESVDEPCPDRKDGIFAGVRTSEETVFHALRLLARGVSLQIVSESLEIKPTTIRRWLNMVAGQSGSAQGVLRDRLAISRQELDTLLDYTRRNTR